MWEPHDPISYFAHIVFGISALLAGAVALSVVKGSDRHRLAGRVFAAAMTVTSVTTLIFMRAEFSPLAMVQALGVLYMIPTSLAAVRNDQSWAKVLDVGLMIIPLLMLVIISQNIFRMISQGVLIPGPFIYFTVFTSLLVGDVRLMISRARSRAHWIRRHLLRMLLAFSFAIMAALREVFEMPVDVWATVPFVAALLLAFYFSKRPGPALAR